MKKYITPILLISTFTGSGLLHYEQYQQNQKQQQVISKLSEFNNKYAENQKELINYIKSQQIRINIQKVQLKEAYQAIEEIKGN